VLYEYVLSGFTLALAFIISMASIIEQYLQATVQAKIDYGPDTIVLMQVGGFFELYGLEQPDGQVTGSDIVKVCKFLELAVVHKSNAYKGQPIMMAGFVVGNVDKYLTRLQSENYTTVLMPQVQGKDGSFDRKVAEVISPGTYCAPEPTVLTNFIACIWLHQVAATRWTTEHLVAGVALMNVLTGESLVGQFKTDTYHVPVSYDDLERVMTMYKPSESLIVGNIGDTRIKEVAEFVGLTMNQHKLHSGSALNTLMQQAEKQIYQRECLGQYFGFSVEEMAHNEDFVATQAMCLLIDFVHRHSPNLTKRLTRPVPLAQSSSLLLANHSLQQLNITEDHRHSGKLRSVSTLLNECQTNMGKRLFNYLLQNPSTEVAKLQASYTITAHTLEHFFAVTDWRKQLSTIMDLERFSRLVMTTKVTAQHFYNLRKDICTIEALWAHKVDAECQSYIKSQLVNPGPNASAVEANMKSLMTKLAVFVLQDELISFATGYATELDAAIAKKKLVQEQLTNLVDYVSELVQSQEPTKKAKAGAAAAATMSGSLVNLHKPQKSPILLTITKRRASLLQTALAQGARIEAQRFANLKLHPYGSSKTEMQLTSPEIDELTRTLFRADDEIERLYTEALNRFINEFIAGFLPALHNVSDVVKHLDLLQCKTFIANKYNYCAPQLVAADTAFVKFTGIRHPLIEQLQQQELYVTNDLALDADTRGVLLYGTNAVGKTSFIKSVGISIIMAQAGLYVPCTTFAFHPYKAIYTRILGNDNLFKGLSTFAVEMSELRTVLQQADAHSLVLGDELCSGTESDSALSIFTASLEALHERRATFLFATHFHEIVNYEEIAALKHMIMMHMSVVYDREKQILIYDRKLKRGAGESMYGLEVCKALHLPEAFLARAHTLRTKYNGAVPAVLDQDVSRYNAKKVIRACEVCGQHKATEVHHLQHQARANDVNKYIDTFHKNHTANLVAICEACHQRLHHSTQQHRMVKTSNGYQIMPLDVASA